MKITSKIISVILSLVLVSEVLGNIDTEKNDKEKC